MSSSPVAPVIAKKRLVRKAPAPAPPVAAAAAPVAAKPERPKYSRLSYHKFTTLARSEGEGKPLSSIWKGAKVMKKPIWVSEYPDDRRARQFHEIRNALYFYGLGDEWEQMMTDLFDDPCPLEREPCAGSPHIEILRPAPAKGLKDGQKAGLVFEAMWRVSHFSGHW